ncbi:MAG: glycosyltransferase family 4 protein [Fuerstiella sp.]
MKLTLLTNGLPPYVLGGMQTHSANMVKSLSRCGLELDVYHTPTMTEELPPQLFPPDVSSSVSLQQFAPPQRRFHPGHYVAEAKELSCRYLDRFLSRPPTDVIYAKGLMATSFLKARLRQNLSLPPIITNVHGYEPFQPAATKKEYFKGVLLRQAFKYVIDHSDYVVSYGGRITDLLGDRLGVSADRIIEIPGAVDEQFLTTPLPLEAERPRRFAFVGRYERRKGLEELAQVLHHGDMAEHEFHLVGPVPESVVRQFPPTVNCHGTVSDRSRLIELLDSFDVLVCPSWSEGMPNVIMEAMARNTAVVATDVGATCLLVDESNGHLVPPRNKTLLAQAIADLARLDDEQLTTMKVNARCRIVERFTWSTVGRQTVECLKAITADDTGTVNKNVAHTAAAK